MSSSVLAAQLQKLAPAAHVIVRPVLSTFGEPRLSLEQLAGRDPNRWVICGGTELVRRSLRSFPGGRELFVIGGTEQPEIRRRLDDAHYFPNIEPHVASELLLSCAFGYLDYFETPDVPTAAVLLFSPGLGPVPRYAPETPVWPGRSVPNVWITAPGGTRSARNG